MAKFPFIIPLKKLNSSLIIKHLRGQAITVFRTQEVILSNSGKEFNFKKKLNIKHVYTTICSPQANASERVNRSIITATRNYVSKEPGYRVNRILT